MNTLLVFCPQNSFLDPTGSVYFDEPADTLRTRLLDYLSDFQGTKIFFREKHAESDSFFSCDKTHSIVNTPDFNICACFKGHFDLVFDKTRYSGFFGTTLDQYLLNNHINTVQVAGLETHTSVLFTVEELRNRGIEVQLIEPLLASRNDFLHHTAISLMVNSLGAHLIN